MISSMSVIHRSDASVSALMVARGARPNSRTYAGHVMSSTAISASRLCVRHQVVQRGCGPWSGTQSRGRNGSLRPCSKYMMRLALYMRAMKPGPGTASCAVYMCVNAWKCCSAVACPASRGLMPARISSPIWQWP